MWVASRTAFAPSGTETRIVACERISGRPPTHAWWPSPSPGLGVCWHSVLTPAYLLAIQPKPDSPCGETQR